MDGDTVEVLVTPENFTEKGPEGRVVTILTRGRTHLGGIIKFISPFNEILAYVPLLRRLSAGSCSTIRRIEIESGRPRGDGSEGLGLER